MAVTEQRRSHLYQLVEHNLDDEAAATLFEMIDSIANATVNLATKDDMSRLDSDVARLEANIARLEANMATKVDIARLDRDLNATQSRLMTWLLASQAAIATLIGAATTILIAVLK